MIIVTEKKQKALFESLFPARLIVWSKVNRTKAIIRTGVVYNDLDDYIRELNLEFEKERWSLQDKTSQLTFGVPVDFEKYRPHVLTNY